MKTAPVDLFDLMNFDGTTNNALSTVAAPSNNSQIFDLADNGLFTKLS